MASRAVWKGQIRLSLVSIPVELHSATRRAGRVSFRQIHEPTGRRVRTQKHVPGVGPVDRDDIIKGYELGDDEYLLIDPDELDEIKLETKRTLELVQFVDVGEIPPLYYDRPYYVLAEDELAEDAYRVVRDALRQANKVGLGQLTMRGREHLCAVRPCGDGLLLETLHYDAEIRDAEPMFADVADDEPDAELLDVATQLIDRKTAPFDASAYSDSYDAALRDLIEAKRKDKKAPRAEPEGDEAAPKENVVDLMGALRESLEKEAGGKTGKKKESGKGGSGKKKSA